MWIERLQRECEKLTHLEWILDEEYLEKEIDVDE
jgi:hypothetical protein